MQTLVANFTGGTRRALLNGRAHVVAPVTLIVPGVLNGSQGPLYYPAEEIAASASSWNGVPLVVYHPRGPNGEPLSARDPRVMNNQGVGTVFGARADNGKLKAEAWFDVEDVNRIEPSILANLDAGVPIELSTGLFTDNEEASCGAAFNGKPYTHIARNYRPDHLAILPAEVGACSVQDGCGVLVNVLKKEGDEELPAGAFAHVPDKEKPSTWKLRIDDASHIAGAVAAIGKGFRGQRVSIPAKDLPSVRAKIRAAWLKAHSDKSVDDLPKVLANKEAGTMAKLTKKAREELIDGLIDNSCCFDAEDREGLEAWGDDKLTAMRNQMDRIDEQEAVINSLQASFTDDAGNVHTFNQEKKTWETKMQEPEQKPDPKPEPVANEPAKPKTLDEWLEDAPPEVRIAVNNSLAIEKAEKDTLVAQLTENMQGEGKQAVVSLLSQKPLDELRLLTALAPQPAPQPAMQPSYFGAAAPVANVRSTIDMEDSLGLPKWDWSAIAKGN